MNTLSSLLNFIGNTIGSNPQTLPTTSKTLVGAITEEHNRIHISTATPSASDGNDGDIWVTYSAE